MEIRGQVVDLNSPVMQKAAEEIRSRNRESAQDKGKKSNDFLGSSRGGTSPMALRQLIFLRGCNRLSFTNP